MSVNINVIEPTNGSRWSLIKNGDFAVIEGTPEHPIPYGLYRIFIVPTEDIPSNQWILIPMFDGPFEPNMFPYIITETNLPKLQYMINKINIEIEILK